MQLYLPFEELDLSQMQSYQQAPVLLRNLSRQVLLKNCQACWNILQGLP